MPTTRHRETKKCTTKSDVNARFSRQSSTPDARATELTREGVYTKPNSNARAL